MSELKFSDMKILLFIGAVLLGGGVSAQTELPVVVNTSLNRAEAVLFRGYENQIRIRKAASDDATYTLQAEGCSLISQTADGRNMAPGSYIAKPSREPYVQFTVLRGETVVGTVQFKVSNMPDPKIFLGSTPSGSRLYEVSKSVTMGFPEEVPLDFDVHVVSWKFELGGREYKGGNQLSDEAVVAIKAMPKGSPLIIQVRCISPDGITRLISGTWTIG